VPSKVDLEVELPRATVAPRDARHALRSWCQGLIEADLLVDAQLLVSELVANAIFHGRGHITLRARLDEDRLVVEVVDEGSGFERGLRRSDFEQIGGWGLDIVEEVSSRWGVHEWTTHVWFELEWSGPRLGEPDR